MYLLADYVSCGLLQHCVLDDFTAIWCTPICPLRSLGNHDIPGGSVTGSSHRCSLYIPSGTDSVLWYHRNPAVSQHWLLTVTAAVSPRHLLRDDRQKVVLDWYSYLTLPTSINLKEHIHIPDVRLWSSFPIWMSLCLPLLECFLLFIPGWAGPRNCRTDTFLCIYKAEVGHEDQ